jgi:probable F420-dependent oxidoreductase
LSTGIALPPHLELPVREYVSIAVEAERLGYGRLWATEAGSADAFALLTACAGATRSIQLATGILPIQTRSPALTAQASATLQDFSGGRFTLGLGVSTPVVISGWNGLPWEGKLSRLREYVVTVKRLLSGQTVEREHGWYPMKGSRLLMHLPEAPVPVVLAGLGPAMLALAGEIADGGLVNYLGAAGIGEAVERVKTAAKERDGGADPSVAAFVRAAVVSGSAEDARTAAQREVMAKVIVPAYRRSFISQGWGEACERALALWNSGERGAAARSLPEEMTSSIVLIGSAADVHARFAAFRETRLDEPVLYAIATERQPERARAQFLATMRALAPAAS